MNLVIEYLQRDDRCQNLLSLPLSVFLVHRKTDKKVVLLIKDVGSRAYLQFNNIDEAKKGKIPCLEYIVDVKDIFNCDALKAKEYAVLPFVPPFFSMMGVSQIADDPEATYQINQYEDYIDKYLNSDIMRSIKRKFLWESFVKIYSKTKVNYGLFRYKNKELVPNWDTWCKRFVDVGKICGEVVFANIYKKMKYQDIEQYIDVGHNY